MKALLSTSKSRWWIIPICMALSSGLLFAQASGLDRKPSSITVERSYQGRDSKPLLSTLGIDRGSLDPVPNISGVIAAIQSADFKLEMEKSVDVNASLRVFSRENEIDIECNSSSFDNCDIAIDYAAQSLERLRNEVVKANLNEVADVLEIKLESVLRLTAQKDDPGQVADLRLREIDLVTKIESLRELAKSNYFKLFFSGERVVEEATTIYTVTGQTYALGLFAGGILGVLLFMQIVWNRLRREQHTGQAVR